MSEAEELRLRIAATLAYYWRMAEADDVDDPRGETSHWYIAAGLVVRDLCWVEA